MKKRKEFKKNMFKNFKNFKDEDSEDFCLPFGMQYQQTMLQSRKQKLPTIIDSKITSHPFKNQKGKPFYKPRQKSKMKILNFQ